jgi:hypothetical protein
VTITLFFESSIIFLKISQTDKYTGEGRVYIACKFEVWNVQTEMSCGYPE